MSVYPLASSYAGKYHSFNSYDKLITIIINIIYHGMFHIYVPMNLEMFFFAQVEDL